jgi:hypothetical protein
LLLAASLLGAALGQADVVWERLPKLDAEEMKRVEVEKAVKDAGIEFSDWRWLDKKTGTMVAKVKNTKRPLGKDDLRFDKYDAKGASVGGGGLLTESLKANEQGLANVSVKPIVGKAGRVVISLAKK